MQVEFEDEYGTNIGLNTTISNKTTPVASRPVLSHRRWLLIVCCKYGMIQLNWAILFFYIAIDRVMTLLVGWSLVGYVRELWCVGLGGL